MLHSFLHHGTLLYGMDVALMERYLRIPKRQPDYRQGRGHRDFVTQVPIRAEALRQMLREAWQAHVPLDRWPEDETQRLVQSKYGQMEWTYRR
jgi:lipoate-protein ligase A